MKFTNLQVDNFTFEWGRRTYLMGILNVTPDSFSGDGLMSNGDLIEQALRQAEHFIHHQVDILDIGGESTRPGSQPVSADQECERIIPVVQAIRQQFPNAIISLDTSKAAVAEAGFKAGAHMLNDVWALRADPELASVAKAFHTPVVLMHNRSNPASMEVRERLGNAYAGSAYENLMDDVQRELLASVELAHQAGIEDQHIILDPGVGFGKTREQNLELINRLGEIRALGYPVLLGPSRKSFIGFTLDLPPDQRVEGTAATVAVGITRGADIIRVHDVKEMARVAKMTDALVRA